MGSPDLYFRVRGTVTETREWYIKAEEGVESHEQAVENLADSYEFVDPESTISSSFRVVEQVILCNEDGDPLEAVDTDPWLSETGVRYAEDPHLPTVRLKPRRGLPLPPKD